MPCHKVWNSSRFRCLNYRFQRRQLCMKLEIVDDKLVWLVTREVSNFLLWFYWTQLNVETRREWIWRSSYEVERNPPKRIKTSTKDHVASPFGNIWQAFDDEMSMLEKATHRKCLWFMTNASVVKSITNTVSTINASSADEKFISETSRASSQDRIWGRLLLLSSLITGDVATITHFITSSRHQQHSNSHAPYMPQHQLFGNIIWALFWRRKVANKRLR